jgi:predicted CoA-binding protein
LKKEGYNVLPVNPNMDKYLGETCYNSVNDLPREVETLIFALPNKTTREIIEGIKDTSIKQVWLNNQNNSKKKGTLELVSLCQKKGIGVVYGVCPFMFLPGRGFHIFHFKMKRFFGGLPKQFVTGVYSI